MHRRERAGLAYAALCAINGAFVPAFAKLTTGLGDPLLVAAVTSLFAAACGFAIVAARGELAVLVGRRTAPRLLLIAALGTGAAFYLFFLGASRSSAIDTVLCLQTEPAYALVLAWIWLGNRPTPRRVGATVALMAGIALAIGTEGLSASSGTWMLLATPMCWQLSHLVALRGLRGVTPAVLTAARYVYGSVLLVLLYAVAGDQISAPPVRQWLRLLPLLGVQGIILSYGGTLLWYSAVTRLDLARTTSIVVPSIPLLSLAASFALLGEVPTLRQLVGLLLTAAGVYAYVTAPQPATALPPAPRAGGSLPQPLAKTEGGK